MIGDMIAFALCYALGSDVHFGQDAQLLPSAIVREYMREVVSSAFCDCDVGDPRFDRGVDVALAGYYGDDPADALVEMGEA